jgi:hypothetical protein
MVTAGASNNAIGGTSSPASPNLIAFNGGAGISLTSTAGTGNAIRHNSIDLNGGLGIDLDADGVTPNDPGDTDSGPNALMNYPVLTSVTLSGGSAAVAGTLNSLPGANFNIDYFASKNPDASGFGEAGRFLATAGASTDGSGNATLSPSLIARLMPGEWLTATATDSSDNTSELSRALFVQTLFADVHSAAGTASNTNRVFEPGETVLVEPAWQNVGAVPLTLTGAASSFIGPSGPGVTYTLVDPIATYGLIAPNAKNDCFTAGHCYQFMVSNPATRPALHWDSTFLETMSDGRTKTWTLHIGSSFTDVPTSAGYYRFVEALLHSGITAGCGGTGYCPGSPVTRAQMAVFLLLAEHGSAYIPPPATGTVFADVPASNGFAKWIEQLAAEGITGGCGGGNYCPNSSITRQQMAVFLLVAEHGTGFNPPPATGMFADVPPSSGFAKWVERLAVEGVTSGCGSGNFCPNDPVSRGQMAVFLSVAFGISLYGT